MNMIRSGAAIASLILGVLTPFGGFLFPPIPILAVVFGHAAMKDIRSGYREGRGMALTGLYLGWIAVTAYMVNGAILLGYFVYLVSH